MVKAISIAVMIFLGLIAPLTTNAQSDGFFRNNEDTYDNRDAINIWTANNGFQHDDFGESPLGSGLLVMLAAGASYAISRRRRNFKKGTTLLLVALMLIGMTNCKKKIVEPIIQPTGGNKVAITLNVGGGAKAEVDPPHVNFEENDKILVAHDGEYVGTLTYTEYGTGIYHFEGNIDASVAEPAQKLYFYFLGNMQNDASLTAGSTTSCTVNISNQTDYPTLPVISFSASNEDFTGSGAYSTRLHNKASLMKFNVTTPSSAAICITGMNNKVTVDFSKAANDGANNGFTYDKDGDGIIKLKGGSGTELEPAEKWAIVLPQAALAEGEAVTAYTNGYSGVRPAIPAITADQYLSSGIAMTVNTAANILDLATVTENTTISDGWTVIGTLGGNYQISIADGATVTLSDATINGVNDNSYRWAGLNCLGTATIIMADGTTNTVKGFYDEYPGIHVPSGSTLTIEGTGTLDARSNGWAAGIGGGFNIACGNIEIQGGTINATGGFGAAGIGAGANSTCGSISITNGTVVAHAGDYAAGIGAAFANGNYSTCSGVSISGGSVTAYGGLGAAGIGSALSFTGSESYSQCGDISITGGTVVATGGNSTDINHPAYQDNFHAYGGAGIGTGATAGDYSYQSNCGNITIGKDVYSVTATKGDDAQNSIGKNHSSTSGTCGTVSIGGTVYWGWTGSIYDYMNGGSSYLPTSPLIYPEP